MSPTDPPSSSHPLVAADPLEPAGTAPSGAPRGGVVAVLTAAGSGRRLGSGGPKALATLGGATLLRRAAQGLVDSGVVDHIVVTAPAADVSRFRAELVGLAGAAGHAGRSGADGPDGLATGRGQTGRVGGEPGPSGPVRQAGAPRPVEAAGPTQARRSAGVRTGVSVEVVAGSQASRQASVQRGLEAALVSVPRAQVVLVHDAARALTPPEVTRRVVAAVRAGHDAVVPALPVTDTVKEVGEALGGNAMGGEAAAAAAAGTEAGAPAGPGCAAGPVAPVSASAQEPTGPGAGEGRAEVPLLEPVVATPERSRLRAVQTPQGFATACLVAAHRAGARRAGEESQAASDDAGLVEALGGQVVVVAGHERALKITTPLDLVLAEALLAQEPEEALTPPAGAAG